MVRILKRFTAIAAILLLILMTSLCFSGTAWGAMDHMIDDTGYMTQSEAAAVNSYLTMKSEELQFDMVCVLTEVGYDEDDLRDAADYFYENYGYGYGSERDGVIFVVDMGSRLMTLVTTGFGIEAITDYGEEVIYDYVTDSLQRGDFVEAFEKFADTAEDFVLMAREGTPVDVDDPGHDGYDWYEGDDYSGSNLPDAETAAGMGGISLAAGAGAGFFSSQRQKSKLKTVRRKYQANSYARRDSLVLSRKQDRFLYSTVAVVPRPKQNNDNHRRLGGGGGGTTIHMGPSGMPHGGGHARGF